MDGNPSENISISEELKASAVNSVSEQYQTLAKTDPIEFIKLCHKEFCRRKIAAFPRICEIARMQNMIKWRELYEIGNRGKYTETYGWSAEGTMKFQFEIPQDLYHFMQNLVYDGFWEPHNKKIADKFMNRLCKGEDPTRLLVWVRTYYGKEQGKVIGHGF